MRPKAVTDLKNSMFYPLKLVIDIICYFIRKLPFVTHRFRHIMGSLAFSRSTFLDWIFWGRRILEIWWRRYSWCLSLPYVFCLFMFVYCLSCSSEQGLNGVWFSLLWLLLASWLFLTLLVVPSIFVISSIHFILKRDISPVSLPDMMEGNLLRAFLQSSFAAVLFVTAFCN